ncbi:MAG: glutamate racemase [Cetobacterium sp.]
MKVGVFDSGVGGLTVLKELLKELNSTDFIYYGDSLNSPYGTKSIEDIRSFSYKIGEFLINQKVDLIVIACNTATVASLDYLKEKFPTLPIIGVINPGANMALKQSQNKKIGVLSTPLTAKTNAYKNAIRDLNPNYEVYQQGCELLCPMIEKGWEDNEKSEKILKDYINQLPKDIDTLILGCTHYPYLEEKIKTIVNYNIVNPAKETAKLVKEKLNELRDNSVVNIEKLNNTKKLSYYVSGNLENFVSVGEQLLDRKIENAYKI